MKLLSTLKDTIKTHKLISRGDSVLVALSGGSDSVALLHLLLSISGELGFSVGAAHVNHSLRDTADRDMNFCKKLCRELDVPLEVLTVDIREGAKASCMGEELYARCVRYDFFESLGYDKIATAHNKNDNAETMLFNFMRGSSLGGLCGIPYMRGKIIRPLLDIKKSEINEFCEQNSFEFMTDETNFLEIYTRNKIRLSLIPQIENDFNENFVSTVTSNSRLLSYDEEFLEAETKKIYRGEILSGFAKTVHPAILFRLIQLYYKEKTATFKNLPQVFILGIASLLKKDKTGSKIDLPNGFEAYISYGKLIIDKKSELPDFEYEIKPCEPIFIPEIQKVIVLSKDSGGKLYLDNTDNIKIRNKRKGDIFYPVGMSGKKRLSDYFTDKKIPQKMRAAIPLLTKDGEIVSVIGYRNDRRFTSVSGADAYSITVKEATDE